MTALTAGSLNAPLGAATAIWRSNIGFRGTQTKSGSRRTGPSSKFGNTVISELVRTISIVAAVFRQLLETRGSKPADLKARKRNER